MTTLASGAAVPSRPSATLARTARVLEIYSTAAVRIAEIGLVVAVVIALLAVVGNVFTRQVLGFSIFGANELASFAFLWTIWLGVSLAVKRGSVTTITILSHSGPGWWQRSVRTFAGVSLAVLLAYCCWRSTQFALGEGTPRGLTSALGIPFFYPVVSMAVGYYFISLHYLHELFAGAVRVRAAGQVTTGQVAGSLTGAAAIGAIVWGAMWAILEVGGSPLIAIGVMFIALTLAGTPVVFMLSMVGIAAMFAPGFLGLEFYPNVDRIAPFFTTQATMGLSGGTELLVILMFLIVAEVMNASGMSRRLINAPASLIGHLRGGTAYVAQVTSVAASGISGSAQADAAIMTTVLVPEMERDGYRRDVAAAVVAGASIKGPLGPLSIMFIVYGVVVQGAGSASINKLLWSGIVPIALLFILQAFTIYIVVRRVGFVSRRSFPGGRVVARAVGEALPILAIPGIILGGIETGVFTPSEAGSIAAIVTLVLALFAYASIAPGQLPGVIVRAGIETGIVMLLLGDSSILAKALFIDGFGQSVQDFMTGLTDNRYVFLLVVNLILLAVGIFIEPLPALYILAPFLAPVAAAYGVDPVHFGLIMVFNLVLALIHPPVGLVVFLVASIAKVSVERLSITILPWLAVSLLVLFLITYLPSELVLVVSNLID